MTENAHYITTTLPYVNADPHIGFAAEIVVADALARYWRLMGHEVFFTTGTDEHGQKIFEKAQGAGQEVLAYVDHFAGEFGKLKGALDLSYDHFIRTTDPAHETAAQEIWRRCAAAGDIYKKSYKGLYCVGDEMFLRESDLVNGRCPNHPNVDPIELEEENYFFKLSAYQDRLLEYLAKPDVIIPEWRREEAINFVKNGLEDFSISREKARLSWGIAVPDDDSQVMYVWFDALTSYISTLGWPDDAEGDFKKFWTDGQTLQLAGKDQVRFQSIIWQAMLMSAGIKGTDQVAYHGFINSGGQKMSKSLGNVIAPAELVEKYGTDATRYILLRHVHPFEDSDITWERMDEWYTANLVNGLGNLVARVMTLAETHLPNPVKLAGENTAKDMFFYDRMEELRCDEAFNLIFRMVSESDEVMTQFAPYKKVKSEDSTERDEALMIIDRLVRDLVRIASHLSILMPQTSEVIMSAVLANKKPENLFPRLG